MKTPSKEWGMVCDLLLEMEHRNIHLTHNAEEFIDELYLLLDEYAPFLEQRSEDQRKWLTDLWNTHCADDSDEIDVDFR